MPWTTPTLNQVRIMMRDDIVAAFSGVVVIGNSVLRVMSDTYAGLGHLTLRYIDWLSEQFLPDTSEKEWLDRHGDIWLVNADGSVGRKSATQSQGSATATGTANTVVASGTPLQNSLGILYQMTEQITLFGSVPTEFTVQAIDPGTQGNMIAGDTLDFVDVISGVDSSATVVSIDGGVNDETDDELRARVLFRIRQPPMGGDSSDYVVWATAVSGVTRAWVAPLEMGMGTVTIRFMMDDLRAVYGGFPTQDDIIAVTTYIDKMRPVAIKDRWVLAPIPERIDFIVTQLDPDTVSIRTEIEVAVKAMLQQQAAPAHSINGITQPPQTIYAAWVNDTIMNVSGVRSFTLIMDDHIMPTNGSLGILGSIVYA